MIVQWKQYVGIRIWVDIWIIDISCDESYIIEMWDEFEWEQVVQSVGMYA